MGLMDGGFAQILTAASGALQRSGVLQKYTYVADGEGGGTAVNVPHPFKFTPQQMSESMKRMEGFTRETRRFFVYQITLNVPITTDDSLLIDGETFQVESVDADPANSYWDVYATRVPKPS